MTHPFMRLHPLLLPALVMPLGAQDPWVALVKESQDESVEALRPWILFHRPSLVRSALTSEVLMPARATRELQRREATPEAMEALGLKLDTKPAPEWALVDPKGQVRAHGVKPPEAKALREAMEEGGWRPRWELRQAFLREHPGQGDAILDAISEVGQRFFWLRILVESQRQKGPAIEIRWSAGEAADPAVAKALAGPFADAEVVRPCKEAMAWFQALPNDDPEKAQAWTELWSLGMGGIQSSPELTESLRGLLQGVEGQLHREPTREDLWRVWRGLAGFLPEADAETLVAGLEPAPGTAWPTVDVARALVMRLDAANILERAESELAGTGEPQARLKAWGTLKLESLLQLKRYEDARQWILQARRRDPGAFEDRAVDRVLDAKDDHLPGLQAALGADVEGQGHPDVPSRVLTLLVLGAPPWAEAVKGLDRHPAFDAWSRHAVFSPGEFHLLVLTPEQERDYRKEHPCPPGARWMLIAGDDRVIAQGIQMPDPVAIAGGMRGAAPPLLERLDAFLRVHPDHRQALEQRVELLAARMPHPRLELKLAQACAALGEAALLRREDDFTPQLPLWEPVAKRVLPDVEARLQRWPESLAAWMAWMDWQSVVSRPESPAEQLRRMAVWKTFRAGGRGPLPLGVAAAVAQRLERAKRWKDLGEWGLLQWDGGWRQAMGWGRVAPSDEPPQEAEAREKTRKDLATLVSATLRGLRLSNRKGEAQRLEDELKGGDSALLAGLGREKR